MINFSMTNEMTEYFPSLDKSNGGLLKKSRRMSSIFFRILEKYGFPFSYVKVVERKGQNGTSDVINSVTKLNNSLSNGEN